ncbi:MAG: hypothetical protein ISS28_00445 [Candidatus Cloacimonetes bacterium]|nr:hypothetical protein [Candidatus Cloacimonadota bacterium]MBL7085556.1 hypothetical protein [Candidatus Cloacimonadota bacterium]
MKKKKIIFIIVLFSMFSTCTFSYALYEFTCIFTLYNTSATNLAFGLDSGTANIWHKNPLDIWSNPAKLGYYKGFAFGYSHDKWFDDLNLDIYHNSSYLTFGWKGLGILLPSLNNSSKFGTTMDYGEQEVYDAHGNLLRKFNSYETCSQFAFGINCLEFINYFSKENQLFNNLRKYSELSLGLSIDYIRSNLLPYISDSLKINKGTGLSNNIGALIKITPLNIYDSGIRLDITAGINIVNIFKSDMTYKYNNGDKEKQPLPYGNRTGIAGKLSFINIKNLADEYPLLFDISKYLLSIYASYDNSKYGDNPSIWGKGIELTLLDIFSWRFGECTDKYGQEIGDCEGWGINLNYKNIVSFQYNYVEFPLGESQTKQKKEDISFGIDIIKLINEFK